MQDLRVIGVENGALVVAAEDGTRFRIPIDEVLHSKLRQSVPDPGTGRRLAPKEIQAHIRSGMSAQDVASITGVPLDYIQRFEGPVVAEREFVVQSALDVAVHTAGDTDPMRQGKTFGIAIRERLHELGAINERWASWKEVETGWVVKLAFTANQIDHDARWGFDPKKQALSPLNNEALTLSQQGDAAGALIPRLRAVSPTSEILAESARFDSGAFAIDQATIEPPASTAETPEPIHIHRGQNDDETGSHGNQTADLLEALRRRRGEREAASFDDEFDPRATHPSTGSIRIVEAEREIELGDDLPPRATQPQPIGRGSKKGRVSMPSWDEIVFGARPDDDLA
ncbi:MAG: septation protein SepH [Rhodoglobus sp.]